MTLSDKYKSLDYVPGHKEWILLNDVCKEVDHLKELVESQALYIQILEKMLALHINKEPTYGPMLEEDDE